MELTRACKELLIREPFYGLFLLGINKKIVYDTSIVSTLGVAKQGLGITLFVNDTFWKTLTNLEQLAVLKHELLHVCFHHIIHAKDYDNHEQANIAADAEVNCYIENLPQGAVTYQGLNEEYNLSLTERMGTRVYYNALTKVNPNNQPQPQLGNGGGDDGNNSTGSEGNNNGDHKQWKSFSDLTASEKKLMENQINHQLKNTAEQVQKMRGTIPGELKTKIDELFHIEPPVFDWKGYLRRLMGTSIDVYAKKTRRKESERFPGSAGIKVKRKHHLLVAIDTSGSVSETELKEFFSEIHHMYRAGTRVHIIECDTHITREYEYKGKWDGECHGRGGTNFEPVFNYYNEHRNKYTTMIFFTDGEAPFHYPLLKRMIWLISSNGSKNNYPGITVYIPKTK